MDLMRPRFSKVPGQGIHFKEDVLNVTLEPECIENEIFVVDDLGFVIGAIDRQLLQYLTERLKNALWLKMFNIIEDGIVAIDCEGRIFFANDAYSEILGIPLSKIIGKFMQDIEPKALIVNVLKQPRTVKKSKQYIASLNKYVSLKISPIFDHHGLNSLVSIFSDATEIVRLNDEVERVNGIAQQFKDEVETQRQLKHMNIIGNSAPFLNAVSKAMVAAKTDAIILLRGENGVGKEVFARMIHQNSRRKDEALITVNCAAIPENLIESELFGYEEGTFTGAKIGGKKGKFELAHRGTLFLDEIGDMPISMQSKLLRVLEAKEIEKIGGVGNVKVDTRIITATNQPLESLIEQKKFRKDLYYRLNLVEIEIPPLRERREDIQSLISHFLNFYNIQYGKTIEIEPQIMNYLISYSWPGNVRELQNCIQYGVIMGTDKYFELRHSPKKVRSDYGEVSILNRGSLKDAVNAFEKEYIRKTIESANNNKTVAMRELGLSRRTFYRKIHDLNL